MKEQIFVLYLIFSLMSCSDHSHNNPKKNINQIHCPKIGKFYPKKVRDTLTFEVLTSLGIGQYEIKNIQGEICKKGYVEEGITIINCKLLKDGTYTLTIINCDEPPFIFEKY